MTGQHCRIDGLDKLRRRALTWPVAIDRAVLAEVLDEARPLVGHMRSKAGAIGGPARHAGRTVRLATSTAGVRVQAGPTAVLMGAEFGSKRRAARRRSYVTRSRKGTPYVVTRRTKMQFRQFLGTRGYWFWPTVRTDLRGINERIGAIVTRTVQP